MNGTLHWLSKANMFLVVDTKDRLYQMLISQESRNYTTFWIPIGHYQYVKFSKNIFGLKKLSRMPSSGLE